jgi:hypothetical protein
MSSYISKVKVKRFLGIPSGVTMHDDLIDDELIPLSEMQINSWCGTPAITVTTYNEKYDIGGNAINTVILREFPVSSVAAVTNNGSSVDADLYYVDGEVGAIRLVTSGSFFSNGRQKVEVTYTAGVNPEVYTDLKNAAVVLCAFHFNATRNVGLTFEKSGRYQYKRSTTGMPDVVATILARYVRAFARS